MTVRWTLLLMPIDCWKVLGEEDEQLMWEREEFHGKDLETWNLKNQAVQT